MQKSLAIESPVSADSTLYKVGRGVLTAPKPHDPNYQVKVIPGEALDSALVEEWRSLQQSNPDLQNPCFAPEFTQSVAAVRNDVEIGIIEDHRELPCFDNAHLDHEPCPRAGAASDLPIPKGKGWGEGEGIARWPTVHEAARRTVHGNVVAIFPFQRKAGRRGIPVGGIVSDYQGLICRPGFSCDPTELLKACRLISWDFDRLLATQQSFKPFHKLCEPSAMIDLSQGYQAYVAERRAAGTEQIKKCMNLMRRLQLEVGPLRFVPHSSDRAALATVLGWKSRQYRKTGWRDLFALKWGRAIVERIHTTKSESFAGMLSLLYAGDDLIAGHLGMRSRSVWHYWFPAYDPQFTKYSPGLILLLKMAEHAPQIGLRTIDLGTGLTLYKRRLMNASISVAEGSVERPSWLSFLRHARRKAKRLVQICNT